MKKIVSFAAIAAALLSTFSCKKEDVISSYNEAIGTEIQVTAMMAEEAISTKAVTNTTDSSLTSFRMNAWAGTNQIITNATFDKPGSGNAADLSYWSDGNKYYWSGETTSYYFIGIANDNATTDLGTVESQKVTFIDYTVGNSDPVVAFATGTQNAKVTSMVFNHILSRVNADVKATLDSNYNIKAKFEKYTLNNVGKKATITVTPSGVSVSDVSTDDASFSSTAVALSATAKTLTNNAWCNVIPGTTVTDTITVMVSFYDSTTNALIGTRYLSASKPSSGWVESYAAGTQYTYHVEIINDGGGKTDDDSDFDIDDLQIKITSITVNDWGTANGGDITFSRN